MGAPPCGSGDGALNADESGAYSVATWMRAEVMRLGSDATATVSGSCSQMPVNSVGIPTLR